MARQPSPLTWVRPLVSGLAAAFVSAAGPATVVLLTSLPLPALLRAQPFECVDSQLVVLDGTVDVLEEGVTIDRPGISGGAMVGTNVEFSCGACEVADFEDAVPQIAGAAGSICGYVSQIPLSILENGDRLCARSTLSQRRWQIDLRSWLGSNGQCVDADFGASCVQANDFSSYERCEYRPGIPVADLSWAALKLRFE